MKTRIELTQSKKFTDAKKMQATYFLNNFKSISSKSNLWNVYLKLCDIETKGYYIKNKDIYSIFPLGYRLKDISFAKL